MTVTNDSRRGSGENERKPLVRGGLLAALALGVVIATGVGAFALRDWVVERIQRRNDEAARGRSERVTSAAIVALPPLAVKVPLIERPGKDEHGYPRSYVDRAGLRTLLKREKYQELTRYLEQFQADFEADFHAEYFLNDAAEAFETAEKELEPRFDAWVSATPTSFAPYLARGSYRFAVGVAGRGFAYARKTNSENFAAMNAAFGPAFADLEQALSKNPRVVPALRDQIRIAFIGGEYQSRFHTIAKRAFAVCPGCYPVRYSYLVGLQPRWGGSYDEMESAARSAPRSVNPRFATLRGYVDCDRAQLAYEGNDLAGALRHVERAVALGEEPEFLRVRGRYLAPSRQIKLALESLTKALDRRPQDPALLLERAQVYAYESKDYPAAYPDLMLALQLKPADPDAHEVLPVVAQGLTKLGWQAHQERRNQEAIVLLDQATELLPSRDLEARRFEVLTSGFNGSDEAVTKLESEANARPDDFYAQQRLDYALTKRREWNRIATLWNRFIQANPEHGRAYYERSGTLHHLGHAEAARADLERACELGVSAACARINR